MTPGYKAPSRRSDSWQIKKCRKKLFFPAKNFTHYTVSLHNVLINMTATAKSTFKVEQNSN